LVTFLIGLAVLAAGGFWYGRVCEREFGPDDRPTPAVTLDDGVDYVPMNKWKNSLIELLNIAGIGPILGPIQGILFGPVAFLLIPVGCIFGGALHDYFTGMIAMREGGEQMPLLVRKYLGRGVYGIYNVFLGLLMLLVAALYIYTPGELLVTQVMRRPADADSPLIWIVFGVIFIYYVFATLVPIDKLIGKIYPIFGGVMLISTVGIFFGLFSSGYELQNLTWGGLLGSHSGGQPLVPAFFVTVACGLVSGFHSTQSTMLSRTVREEREGKTTFYNMMICEGAIAMVWAAAAMGLYNKGIDASVVGTPSVIGLVANDLLGPIGGLIAILGVIILPLTSGDTALRSARVMLADFLQIDQKPMKKRLMLTAATFLPVAAILVPTKLAGDGFNTLWRYFAWSNQTIALFAFSVVAVYLMVRGKNYLMAMCPGTFYAFVIFSYILNAHIGFNLPLSIAYVIAGALTVAYVTMTLACGHRMIRLYHADLIQCT
jgi:carbon starvation protein CstA